MFLRTAENSKPNFSGSHKMVCSTGIEGFRKAILIEPRQIIMLKGLTKKVYLYKVWLLKAPRNALESIPGAE